jgi:hypothetical protein
VFQGPVPFHDGDTWARNHAVPLSLTEKLRENPVSLGTPALELH